MALDAAQFGQQFRDALHEAGRSDDGLPIAVSTPNGLIETQGVSWDPEANTVVIETER